MVSEVEKKIGKIIALMASDFDGADKMAHDLVAGAPDSTRALSILAYLQNYRRDYAGAVAALEKIIDLDPDDMTSVFNLGYCCQQSGNLERALDCFEKVAAKKEGNWLEAALLGNLCLGWLGRGREASDGFAKLFEGNREHAFVKFYHGWRQGVERGGIAFRDHFNNEIAPALMSFINRYDHNCWAGLDDKGTLSKLIAVFAQSKGSAGFSFWPESFVMPGQRRHMLDKYGVAGGGDDGPLWLVKPTALFGGQGVYLTRDVADTPDGDGWLVQRYVENPLLVQNRKSHIRLYLLVDRLDPVRAWLWSEGIVRFAPQLWSNAESAVDDIDRHITNTQRFLGHEGFAESALPGGPVWKLSDFLAKTGQSEQISHALLVLAQSVTSLIAAARLLPPDSLAKSRDIPPKLLGLDVLVDDTLNPLLLEIERYPALSGGTAETAKAINAAMFSAAVRLICGAEGKGIEGWIEVS